ncbi:MAG TPA: hypothetical protein VE546_10700 [Streptomyces sp.]|uniref:hypothetical protein n=1 Tax=Streptomyces sp. TaxID=1931 RepID=UPI002D6B028D|nr:hypothetical protein [Streptomyces sp.]HZG04025.1 hypothetical protein [Streptomyces sp.]
MNRTVRPAVTGVVVFSPVLEHVVAESFGTGRVCAGREVGDRLRARCEGGAPTTSPCGGTRPASAC